MTTTQHAARHELAARLAELAAQAWTRAGAAERDAHRARLAGATATAHAADLTTARNRAAAYAYDHAAHMTRTNADLARAARADELADLN